MHLRSRTAVVAVVGVVSAATLAACGGGDEGEEVSGDPTAAGGEPQGIEEVCAAAEEEDTLEIWTNWSNPDRIMGGFEEAYPNIDVEHLTILTEDAVPRVITESAGGTQPPIDVFYGNISAIAPLLDREMSDEEIDWESLGVRPELINAENGNIVRVAQAAFGIGYNTDKYSPEELPESWDDLIDPEWRGKLILDPRGRPFPFLATEWGQEETVEYVRELLDVTDPIILQGTTAGILAVAAGEGDILLNSKTPETEEQRATGAPVGIKLLEPIPVEGSYYGVIEGTEQPNAAKCLVAWTAGEEGEQAVFEAEFKTNSMPEEVAEDAETFEVDSEEELQTMLATTEELSGMITGGRG